MKHVFGLINKWERNHIARKYRKTAWYFFLKLTLLLPLVLLGSLERAVLWLYRLVVRGRIERDDKPDVVFSNIVAGFAGLAFPNEKTEVLAKRRAEICAQCPSAVKSGLYNTIVDKRTVQIQGMKCNECGCNLSAKVRSAQDFCPLGKW
jgi:hypothetical protein